MSLYDRMTEHETVICRHCQETMEEGDTYFSYMGETYCPDCMDAIINDHRHVVGEHTDRI